jgi:tape measure domain-containing protein
MNENVGRIEYDARINTSHLKSDARDVDKEMSTVGDSSSEAADRGNKAFSRFAKVGLGATLAAVTAVGVAVISNLGDAIKRVDTLANSTRTFANMGFAADDVAKAMEDLKSSILGLPTPLDAAVSGVQLIASSIGDVGKSQKIFSALNNAILGFGGSADDVTGTIRQLSQAFAGGRIDGETFNSLLDNNLGPALNAIAKQMGVTSTALKEGLSDGTISIGAFQDALIEMNTKGGGGLKSFEQIAKDSTSGIETGFSNMNTAITRGIADIIEKVGSAEISSTIASVGVAFEAILKGIGDAVTIAKYAFDTFFEVLKPAIDYIKQNQQMWEVLKVSLMAIGAIILVLVLTVGVLLVAAFVAISAAIQVAIFIVERIIEAIIAFGQGIANVVVGLNNFGNTVAIVFAGIWNTITSIFGRLVGFFGDVWNRIVGLFSSVGTTVGNAIGNAFKSTINGVISGAVNIINGFINAINGAIDVINNIPGVKIGRLGTLPIPQLATGGIVSSPTLAMIGEGSESEAVIPLSKLDEMINTGDGGNSSKIEVNISMSGIMSRSKSDERDIAKSFIKRINEELKSKGKPIIGGGAI